MAVIMRKTASFALVLLWLVFGAEIARGWGEDMKNDFKQFSEEHKLDEKAESLKQDASEAYDQAKGNADSWSDWAYNKMGFGKNEEVKETTHYVVDKTAEVKNTAAEKAGDRKVKAKETFEDGKEKAAEAATNVKRKSEDVVGEAREKAGDMKVKAREMPESGKEKAAEETVAAAKNKGESAKEMGCKAAGDIGATMREKGAEL